MPSATASTDFLSPTLCWFAAAPYHSRYLTRQPRGIMRRRPRSSMTLESDATVYHPTQKGFADPQSIALKRAQDPGSGNGRTTCFSSLQFSKNAPSMTDQSPSSHARTSRGPPDMLRFAMYSAPRYLLSVRREGM